MLGGYEKDNTDSYLHLYITNNDKAPVKAGTMMKTHAIPTSTTNWGYRIEADYSVKNPDLSTTMWNTSSNMLPGDAKPVLQLKLPASPPRV